MNETAILSAIHGVNCRILHLRWVIFLVVLVFGVTTLAIGSRMMTLRDLVVAQDDRLDTLTLLYYAQQRKGLSGRSAFD